MVLVINIWSLITLVAATVAVHFFLSSLGVSSLGIFGACVLLGFFWRYIYTPIFTMVDPNE